MRTDKMYVVCTYTNFITSSGIFQVLFVTDRLDLKVSKHVFLRLQ